MNLTIRRSREGDLPVVDRLAQLDGARHDGSAVLMAEDDGVLLAALPLAGGRPFADPFRRTAEAVAMLELRRAQLGAGGSRDPLLSRALRAVRRRRRYRAPASA